MNQNKATALNYQMTSIVILWIQSHLCTTMKPKEVFFLLTLSENVKRCRVLWQVFGTVNMTGNSNDDM